MCGMVVLSGILRTHVTVNAGDIYSLLSAVLYAVSIVYLGHKTFADSFLPRWRLCLPLCRPREGWPYCFI